jgi:hypothetical protein
LDEDDPEHALMDAKPKLTKLSPSEIKSILRETTPFTPEREVVVDEVLSNQEIETVRTAAQSDYENLCGLFGLSPVPVDVFSPSKQSTDRTPHGTPVNNFTPLYDTEKVVLPIVVGASGKMVLDNFVFPPVSWDKMSPEWPRWRLDLWHEVLHQVEHDILKTWTGGEVHGESYMKAIRAAVERLNPVKAINEEELKRLVL